MTSSTTCPACNYARQPTDDAPDWQCPNCQKAYVKSARFAQDQVPEVELIDVDPDLDPSIQAESARTVWLSAASAISTLAMMTYASQPWEMPFDLLIGWIGFMCGFGTWAISPYLMLGSKARKLNATTRQSLPLFVGTVLVSIFGAYTLVETIFIHPDAQGGVVFIVLPFLQWIGVAVAVSIAESKWAKPPTDDATLGDAMLK
ncbi:MAG: hypothetical protein A2075_13085 [Geobacteraceae bacterium GWC2_58_44]|nr:MAG: hypothetical protein A2075_13085 [Geobacteraceae bacterium GWC2_58_44]HBG06446.1 hypothetical protein [Geobacter sp.]